MKKSVIMVMVCWVITFCLNPSHAFEEVNELGLTLAQMYAYSKHTTDKRGSLVVLNVKRGSIADRLGIEEGDIILKVNYVETKNHDLKAIVDHYLTVPSSIETMFTLWRPEKKEKLEFILHR
jgi:S1-C subfamily serine protease